ncbi:MAG: recombination protein RmuC [Hyphomicrobiales bacterium]|nr:recombination protein RmuC [Hyphomicrobiales bacterium]
MDAILFVLNGSAVTLLQAAGAACGLALALLLVMTLSVLRGGRARLAEAAASAERQRELDDKMAELSRLNAELSGRLRTVTEVVTSRQVDFARAMSDRLDAVGQRVGQGVEQSARTTADHLAKLGERLAVIDRAQASLASLSQDMLGLKDILSNKQTRGAFGQGRMEAIVRDGLPANAYAFQQTLSNRNRPDCAIRLPGDERLMIVDAKFPLEAFTALRVARDDDERRKAGARVRSDVGKHVRDIAERYFIPGETQDLAMLFVPSEAIYADLQEHFDDVVQKAHRARVMMVSPSLLMLAIQVMQSIVRDAGVREQAHLIQAEVRNLLDDVGRLRERTGKLAQHFRQAQDDIDGVTTSADKIARRGDRIVQMEFDEAAPPASLAFPVGGEPARAAMSG